ncbi:hypothetical protein SADUNF_Sadunf03G0110500 [Salix dunnii]|uniref:Uncharacterized protein n=1 Tax=Salix dunnii TaxID=1413687 RepID=A0A835KE67_9ROSI|nr:hypothetical protein SADUNF_Sadunf03G0110500 [Salix dunnii]
MKDLEVLLNTKSLTELQKSKTDKELLCLIHQPTAKENVVIAKSCIMPFGHFNCLKVHFFHRIIDFHSDMSQGDCSFLETCHHMKTCRYLHYEHDPAPDVSPMTVGVAELPPLEALKPWRAEYCSKVELGEP